ncbi:uncharacterized protein TNCV_4834081 [Trichonephila clavipes]|nr:uncharacterized protein TNCV_4834081 [Trichonephila clavipes]
MLVRVYEDEVLSMKCVYEGFVRFREGLDSVSDNPRSGRLAISVSDQNIEKVSPNYGKQRDFGVSSYHKDSSFGVCPNTIDADSDDENEMNNATPVPASSEMRNITKMQGFNLKNRKDIAYPTIIRSAIRLVPHGPDLPIPSPPDTLDNILDDLDQISHISSDSDDGYDPGTNDPELFSQSDLNNLVRNLGLTKHTAEVLGSRLKERHLLNSGVSFSWYRFREKEFVPFLRKRGT